MRSVPAAVPARHVREAGEEVMALSQLSSCEIPQASKGGECPTTASHPLRFTP